MNNNKTRLAGILFVLSFIMMGYGLTYSIFNSSVLIQSNNLNVASFIFDSKNLNDFQINLTNMSPGDQIEHDFQVTNNFDNQSSDVSLRYQIAMSTYHFIPLNINIYTIEEDETLTLFLSCHDEEFRGDDNVLLCNSEVRDMKFGEVELHNYKIIIDFLEEFNTEEYANLVDFLDIEINSWQRIGDTNE